MIIGNDIIDLKIALAKPRIRNIRFLSKIFSEKEISQLAKQDNPELSIWKIWAMKETAYKAHQRIFQFTARFDPLSYICDLNELHIKKDAAIYDIKIDQDKEHLYAWLATEPIDHIKIPYSSDYWNDFTRQFCHRTGIELEDIKIYKNKFGIPELAFNNNSTRLPVSITHHGRFAAVCFPLINC
ncbi:4'-phosphopantetheinyl transferase superfamily protein [Christiangramia portivictoriae]|uniref:4'-phosphopantetheinyl transferase superfamily protein n=1 Tax=Christiangramia portivictoriae TaxID=326069 RepID=UPI00041DDE3A|nr:4'-phosphopantetheinyl transferase superfamily protein [Christiangramia portivictoriae]